VSFAGVFTSAGEGMASARELQVGKKNVDI
jgi:hypothetical protein